MDPHDPSATPALIGVDVPSSSLSPPQHPSNSGPSAPSAPSAPSLLDGPQDEPLSVPAPAPSTSIASSTTPVIPPPPEPLVPSTNLAALFGHVEGPVEPAFLPRRASASAGGGPSGLYEGQQGVNPGLGLADEVRMGGGEGGEDAELYIPGLMQPTLFLPLPTTDGLTALVEKYIRPEQRPKRDLSGEWRGTSVDELIATRRWHAVARYCHEIILARSAEETSFLLRHWTLRLHALLRLSLHTHFATELSSLYSILPPSSFLSNASTSPTLDPSAPLFHPAVPFEIHVMLATLPGLRGDRERSVEVLGDVVRGAKREYWAAKREGDVVKEGLWKTRVERVGALLGGVLEELNAYPSVSTLFSSLPSPTIINSLTRLHLASGNMGAFDTAASTLPTDEGNSRGMRKARALEKVGKAMWAEAEAEWKTLVEEDPTDAEAINNLAVILLFNAKLPEAITFLQAFLKKYPTIGYSSEPAIFNLATLLELRTEQSLSAKIGLLRGVAEWGGEELRPGAVKLAM
ncbi:tetratricopeptide repeat protein 15 [Pseudohyphozyma bogoriensis]|nr:tetratricopeptide repeat protein 15 [Pseudohyphozyma bogoriensis]